MTLEIKEKLFTLGTRNLCTTLGIMIANECGLCSSGGFAKIRQHTNLLNYFWHPNIYLKSCDSRVWPKCHLDLHVVTQTELLDVDADKVSSWNICLFVNKCFLSSLYLTRLHAATYMLEFDQVVWKIFFKFMNRYFYMHMHISICQNFSL